MYFSQAFIAALSLSAASAMPVRHVERGQDLSNFNKLAIRGAPADVIRANMLLGRAPTPEMVAAADQIQAIAARQSTSSMTGVLQVLSCLLDILLGRDTEACTALLGNSTGNGTNATAASRQQLASMLTDLSGVLNTTSKDLQTSAKKASSNKKQTRSLLVRDDASINDVLGMLNNLGQLVQKLMTDLTALGLRQQQEAEDGSDDGTPSDDFPPTSTIGDEEPAETSTADSSDEATATDDASATDAPTTTDAPTSAVTSAPAAEKTTGVNCPSPYPNDGMYRPGCPGYGRRRRALAARDASQEQLKQVLPALATLIEAMPGLLTAAGTNGTSSNSTDAASNVTSSDAVASNLTALADSNAYKKVVKQLNNAINYLNNGTVPSTEDSSASNSTDSASTSTSSAKSKSSSTAAAAAATSTSGTASDAAAAAVAQLQKTGSSDSRQAVAAAQIAHGSRDLSALLNADGFQYVKRSQGNNNASQANQGGINIDVLNNLLNGLLSGRDVQARAQGNNDASQANQGGINIDVLNNLLNGLLSGRDEKRSQGDNDASQANTNGINIDVLNNLLNGVLSGRDVEERGTSSKADLAAVNKLFSQILSGHAK